MSKGKHLIAMLAVAFVVTVFFQFALTEFGHSAYAVVLFSTFIVGYNYLLPILFAHAFERKRNILTSFMLLAAAWAIYRGFNSSYGNFRSAGFQLISDGAPTAWYFLFDSGSIAAIALLTILVRLKVGRR